MYRLVAALIARVRRRDREPTDVQIIVERYRKGSS